MTRKKLGPMWELLETYLHVECIVVESTRNKGLVSLRPTLVKPNEGGMGTTLQTRLTEAGFKPGDLVIIVPVKGSRRPNRRKPVADPEPSVPVPDPNNHRRS